MKKRKIPTKIVATLLSVIMVLAPTTQAFATASQTKTEIGTFQKVDSKLDIQNINDSEVHVTVTENGHKSEGIFTKDSKNVHSKYLYDNKLVYTDTQDLKKAIEFGEAQKESIKQVKNTVSTSNAAQSQLTSSLMPSGDYRFDGMVYIPKGQYVPYAHPDRNYYSSLSPYSTWEGYGTQNYYRQIDVYDTNSLLQSSPWVIGGSIAVLITAALGGNVAAGVTGAAIGAIIATYYGGQIMRLADECGCLWVVIDKNPSLVNKGSQYYPAYYAYYRYIGVGPYSVSDYYYYISGAQA